MSSVKVNLGELKDAAARYGKMQRAPAGARGQVVRNTLLRREGDHLIVDTPFVQTGVPISEGRWRGEYSVNARDFSAMIERHVKTWADIGGAKIDVWLETDIDRMTVRWTDGKSTRAFSVPCGRSKP